MFELQMPLLHFLFYIVFHLLSIQFLYQPSCKELSHKVGIHSSLCSQRCPLAIVSAPRRPPFASWWSNDLNLGLHNTL